MSGCVSKWVIEAQFGYRDEWTQLNGVVFDSSDDAERCIEAMRAQSSRSDCPPQYQAYARIPLRVNEATA